MNAARSRRLMLFTLLAVVPIGAIVWQFVLKDRIVAKRWGVVEPGRIYRSGQLSRHLVRRMLEDHRIRVVVDLTEIDPHDADQAAERDVLRQLGIESRRFPLVGDGTGDLRQYAAAIQAIGSAVASGKPVLVHCHAGAQRTGGVIAAYRLLVQHRSPDEVRREMIRFGWNPQRDAVLLDYLNTHLAELANLLAAERVITSVPGDVPHL